MKLLKRLMKRIPVKKSMHRFESDDLKVEWQEGNNLKITFLNDCYMMKNDTLNVNTSFAAPLINPGVVYDAGIKYGTTYKGNT